MNTLKVRLKKKKAELSSAHGLFRNEDGAIDLSSIMVGIIVIGLIGGVIAATVFTVIPWSQDNAAKEQLQSIHTAQNAYYGFSSDPSRTLAAGQTANSFADSAGLAGAAFLSKGDNYCTVPLASGKDYIGFVKSASGKVFAAKNSDKKATIAATSLPCSSGEFKDALLAPTFPLPDLDPAAVTPPAPVYTPVRYHPFEDINKPELGYFSSSDYISVSWTDGLVGNGALYVQTANSGNVSGNPTRASYSPRMNLVVGQKYRVTFRTRINSTVPVVTATTGTYTSTTTTVAGVSTVTLEFIPTTLMPSISITATHPGQYNRPILIVDEFKLDRVD